MSKLVFPHGATRAIRLLVLHLLFVFPSFLLQKVHPVYA